MITRRQLALTAAVVLAALVAMNAWLVFLTRNSVPRGVMRYARTSQSAGVLALGNSIMEAGFDEPSFDAAAGLSASHGAANLGLGSSDPVEHLLLLRYALAHGMRPHLVVYGFFDFQLTDASPYAASTLIGNYALRYYLEPFYARRFYSLSFHDAVEFSAMHALPMYAERGAVWEQVEMLRRGMAEQGMPAVRANRFGRTSDFSLLEAGSADAFQRQCETSLDLPLAPPVDELLRQARDAGIGIAVVEMPMNPAHRRKFYDTVLWPRYVVHVRSLLARYGVTYLDASRWIDEDARFTDSLHLSAEGAVQFSRLLGSALAAEDTAR